MPLNTPIRNWSEQTVWIIGASSGIGRACATALHQKGAQVIVSARSKGKLDDFSASHTENSAHGHQTSLAYTLDVTDAENFIEQAKEIMSTHQPSLVVYCAGYYRPMRANNFSWQDAMRHNDVNYVGALNTLAAILPHWTENTPEQSPKTPPHISLVGSIADSLGLPHSLAYGPTKAALYNLAQALYIDLNPDDASHNTTRKNERNEKIGVSIVRPGFVSTELTKQNQFAMPALQTPEEAAERMIQGWEAGHFNIHFPKRFTWPMRLAALLPHSLRFRLVQAVTKQ